MSYKKSVLRSLTMVTQLGFSVLTPIFLCLWIGYLIDQYTGWKTIVIFLIIGTISGGKCAYDMVKKVLKAEEKEEAAEKRENLINKSDYHTVNPKQPSRIKKNQTDNDSFQSKEESDGR